MKKNLITKQTIIDYLRDNDIVASKKDANFIITTIFDFIKDALTQSVENWDKEETTVVTIKDFGSFSTRMKKEQTKSHPITKERMTIAEHKVVKFKKGRGLKFKVS